MRDQWQRGKTTARNAGRKRRARADGDMKDGLNRPGSKRRRKLAELAEEETDRMLDLVEAGQELPD